MSESIQFTRNYEDKSTDQGFQFEFFCDRCGNGYRTRFRPFAAGMVSGVLDTASSLLGGILSRAADVGNSVSSANRERAHDQAFLEAAQELKTSICAMSALLKLGLQGTLLECKTRSL